MTFNRVLRSLSSIRCGAGLVEAFSTSKVQILFLILIFGEQRKVHEHILVLDHHDVWSNPSDEKWCHDPLYLWCRQDRPAVDFSRRFWVISWQHSAILTNQYDLIIAGFDSVCCACEAHAHDTPWYLPVVDSWIMLSIILSSSRHFRGFPLP